MIKDFFNHGWTNIRKRKLRSWLTMIGIFIGIAAVVSLISLGQGLQKYMDDEFEKLGRDKIMIMPKGAFGPMAEGASTFTDKDIKAIKKVVGITDVTGMSYKFAKLEFNDVVRYYLAIGVPTDEQRTLFDELFLSYDIEFGRNIKKGDKYKVVLGHYYYDRELFEKNVNLRDTIKVNDIEFKTVGFYEIIGNPGDDQQIYIPQDTLEEIYDIEDEYNMLIAKTSSAITPLKGAEKIEKALRKSRDVEEGQEDFSVQTTEELLETYNVILNIVNLVLIGIAAISLLVGGIGIMNTMYTAVIERTKEIGIMKAIGAKNSSIMTLFVIESGILGALGGAIGVAIGMAFSKSVEVIATAVLQTTLLQAYFPWYLIVGSLAFAFVVGTISGLLPARQAAHLKPVDALRYE
ncbi:MAG: ABC transporter permease [Nanoarchaeota archaeon]|nr:ABC transporter permease [Nanoarchaeota archaeon]